MGACHTISSPSELSPQVSGGGGGGGEGGYVIHNSEKDYRFLEKGPVQPFLFFFMPPTFEEC